MRPNEEEAYLYDFRVLILINSLIITLSFEVILAIWSDIEGKFIINLILDVT